LLRIQDKEGKTKFVWKDEDDEPVNIDELILKAPLDNKPKVKEKTDDK
jgi:hypothetical protein